MKLGHVIHKYTKNFGSSYLTKILHCPTNVMQDSPKLHLCAAHRRYWSRRRLKRGREGGRRIVWMTVGGARVMRRTVVAQTVGGAVGLREKDVGLIRAAVHVQWGAVGSSLRNVIRWVEWAVRCTVRMSIMHIGLGCKWLPLCWSKCIALKRLRIRWALWLWEVSVVGKSGRVWGVVGNFLMWRVVGPMRRRRGKRRVARTCKLTKVWDATCAPVWTFSQGPLRPVCRDAIKRTGRASQILGHVEKVWWHTPVHL